MHRTIRYVGIAVLSSSLFGCLVQQETESVNSDISNDDTSVNTPAVAFDDNGLIAPTAPTLNIAASPGVLNFNWVDWQNTAHSSTSTTLYQYNYRTEQETALNVDIEPGAQRHALRIKPHRLAWDSVSYRLEICTPSDCLSSQRVPIKDLLIQAISGITPTVTALSNSFGEDVALNTLGNVALVSSPSHASASVYFHLDDQWIQATTLTSTHFTDPLESSMRASVSASGDTIAIATLSSSTGPGIVVFDRLGESWFETAAFTPFSSSSITQSWDTASLNIQLSDDGDRLIFGAQPTTQSFNSFDNRQNELQVFDRQALNWRLSSSLAIPAQYTRLGTVSASSEINTVVTLSSLNNRLYLHQFSYNGRTWNETSTQLLDTINASRDATLVSSANGAQISVAGWEQQADGRYSAVAWKLEKRPAGWIARDSIRLPPMADSTATLRLAADAQLQTIAVGWQAQADANLALYETHAEQWMHQFSVPSGLNLNRNVALAQSIAISSDNSTLLIGTPNTGNGGMVSSFR